jgi:plasmid stabilization system protein ParE
VTATILTEAEVDLETAFDEYQMRLTGLGHELVYEFRRGVDRILEYPNAWQSLSHVYRRYRLHRFPYGIVYRHAPETNEIIIVAVMHLSQKPGFWERREGR